MIVWCGFLSKGIIKSFFLENEQEEAVTINGNRHRAMLNKFLFTKIEEEDIGNIWFQQGGVISRRADVVWPPLWRYEAGTVNGGVSTRRCYTAESTLDVLRPVCEDHIISRKADVVWPPRSCDLTPLNRYLWGAVKDKCYADNPETIDTLKNNIREAICEMQLLTIDIVLKN